ncbi:MAG: glycosyltransferase family 39 protein [Bacteroidia bacterium]|nr:glycosyltransferase family 39 protein [Bacteroidia bacterium]
MTDILKKKGSIITIVLICLALTLYKISITGKKEISWDTFGYYLYLPATFIHHDPMLNNIEWVNKINSKYELTGTLYMISSNDKGEPMYFFLMGMALFYLPFFITGHCISYLSGYPADGFSLPYQYSLGIGMIIYTILGLIFLRKILRHYFGEITTATVLLLIVCGTNYIHHLTVKNTEPVNVLFMLVCIVVWCSVKWCESYKNRYIYFIGIASVLMILIKPSEFIVLLIPVLWGISSYESLKVKISHFFSNYGSVLLTLGICALLVLPQVYYWHHKTGRWIFDSYKNPGVGLDWRSPHIADVLFSYRKGWLIYTPIMIFALAGFYSLFRHNRQIFLAIAFYFVVEFYLVASWTEWWYGAGFSNRPLIIVYPVLAVCMAYLLEDIRKSKIYLQVITGLVILWFIFLNQFQWWQLKNYILDPYRTTKAYYWATFLETKPDESRNPLLLVYRDFSGDQKFKDKDSYRISLTKQYSFDDLADKHVLSDSNGNKYYKLFTDDEYSYTFTSRYKDMTNKDHMWIRASADIRTHGSFHRPYPCFVLTMERKWGSYGYYAPDILISDTCNNWITYQTEYLTPEIRSPEDILKCYIWKRGRDEFDIDNLKLEFFERK